MPDSLIGVLYQSWLQPDGSFRLEFLSEGAEELLEATADETIASLLDRTFPLLGVDPDEFYRRFEESASNHLPWREEFGYVGPKSGTARWFRAQDFPRRTADGVPFFSGVMIDITELKRVEENSRRAYQQLSAHISNTPLAVVEWDRDAVIRRWSGLAESMFGWTSDEVLGRSVHDLDFIHADDADRVRGVFGELLGQTVSGNVCRNRNLHKSGRVVHCLWHNSIHHDAEGRVDSVLSLAQDLTEQVAIEEELYLSEERLRSSLHFAGMLSWDYDVRKQSMVYSRDVREFFGTPELPPGADLEFGVIHPEDRERMREQVRIAEAIQSDYRLEYRGAAPGPDGRTQWFSSRGSFVTTADGEVVRSIGVSANITGRKQAELRRAAMDNELREARHFESLGLLAGGIAHDFNNLLTIILGNAGVVKILAAPDDPFVKNLDEIDTACQRAADLCNQITAYAGVGRLLAAELDINALLRDAEDGFRALIGPRATLDWHLDSEPCRVIGEARQLKQAVGNILANASEAMGEQSGTIAIHTGRTRFKTPPVGFTPAVAAGDYISIRIVDSGPGMPDAVKARAFEAFFSSKFTGRGLGLAAVSGIVRSHKGSARILSQPGARTTVELLLPAIAGVPAEKSAGSAPTNRSLGNILVVDDDANIRELICSVLEDDGYTVVAAANGRDAEELFDRDPAGFRLAIVDLVMPGIDGHELIRRIRLKVNALPALVVSGYAEREMPKELMDSGPTHVLPKPFRLEQLTAAVQLITSSTPPA